MQTEAKGADSPAFLVVAIAASAGGLKAISAVLAALPADFPAAIVVVQHLSPRQPSQMAEILRRRIALPVAQAMEGEPLRPGHVYLAPPDQHLLVNPGRTLALTHTEKVHFVRPSGDVLFELVAACFGPRAIALILTGGASDGTAGIQAVKKAGGVTLAQDEATSELLSMPRSAIASGSINHVLALDAIAPMLLSLTAV